MSPEMIEMFKVFGSGGAVFLCFYLIHKSSSEQLKTIIEKQSEQSKEMFKILSAMIEQNNLQLGYLQEIKTLVSANLWCPIIREKAGLKEQE